MAYRDFTLEKLNKQFGLSDKTIDLFSNKVSELSPSDFLQKQLKEAEYLPIKSEKARSELIVIPILMELRRQNQQFFTIYSGDYLNVDKQKGLVGECDFIIAKDTQSFTINVPIISLVEAKKQDIESGIGQCAAQMLAAFYYNKEKGETISVIYGCVTTAYDWKFLKLENNVFYIDNQIYFLSQLPTVLGIFQFILNQYK